MQKDIIRSKKLFAEPEDQKILEIQLLLLICDSKTVQRADYPLTSLGALS